MCSERSGSNLVTKIVNSHSRICGPSTKHIINALARNLFRYEPLNDANNWSRLIEDVHRLFSVEFSTWKTQFSLKDMSQLAPIGDVRALIENLFRSEASANGKQYCFVKENQTYEFYPFIAHYFPGSRFVYQVRDPRDMALSWQKDTDFPGGVVAAARQWKKDQQNFLKIFHLLSKQGLAHFLRYENLIVRPEAEAKKLIEFLGFSYEPQVLEFFKDDLTRKNAGSLDSWSNLNQPVMPGNQGKYVTELTDLQIATVESICRYEMQLFSYPIDHSTEELSRIDAETINALGLEERKQWPPNRSPGVVANMSAKKVFYERRSDFLNRVRKEEREE